MCLIVPVPVNWIYRIYWINIWCSQTHDFCFPVRAVMFHAFLFEFVLKGVVCELNIFKQSENVKVYTNISNRIKRQYYVVLNNTSLAIVTQCVNF